MNVFTRMGAIADNILGLKAMLWYFKNSETSVEFEQILTKLEEHRLRGEKLWDFFRDVATKNHSSLVTLITNDDSRIGSYKST